MVWWGREQARSYRRLMIAVVSAWLASWLGVAALIALSVVLPRLTGSSRSSAWHRRQQRIRRRFQWAWEPDGPRLQKTRFAQ